MSEQSGPNSPNSPNSPNNPKKNTQSKKIKELSKQSYLMYEKEFIDDYTKHINNNNCTYRVTLPQIGPTCWFTALMTVLLYSDGMRDLIKKNLPDQKDSPAFEQIVKIITKYFKHTDPDNPEETYIKAQDELNLNNLLKKLNDEDSLNFVFDPIIHRGFKSQYYLYKMLKYFSIDDYLYLETFEVTLDPNKPKRTTLVLSKYNYIKKITKEPNKLAKVTTYNAYQDKIDNDITKIPKVLIILNSDNQPQINNLEYITYQNFELTEEITYIIPSTS